MESSFGFEELEVWKRANAFRKKVFLVVKFFPVEEKYRLIDQIVRSSRSVEALIAEGHGRFSYPDQIHFFIQARGSLSETINHLIVAFESNYITDEDLSLLKNEGKEIQKIMNGYISYLRNKIK
jgi:four helix bundle protein